MKSLHIAVDAHRLLCEPKTSGGTYLGALVREWQTLETPPQVDLLLPYRPPADFQPGGSLPGPSVGFVYPDRPIDPTRRYREQLRWQQHTIPSLLRRCRPEVYFSPFHLTPQLPLSLRVVTAIHDLCFLCEPFFDVGSLVHRAELYSACIRANRLLCVSQFTAEMLARWAPRAASRSTTVHNGVVGKLVAMEQAIPILRALCSDLVPHEYLLWIGHPSPRKNPELLFDVFKAYQQTHPKCRFVIVAPRASDHQLRSLARERGIEVKLRIFSDISQATRDTLYRCATALIFPSRCEGFGFPVLEAMCQGCPAFATPTGPASELLGDLLPMAENLTVEGFVRAINRFEALPAPERERLSLELVARSSKFSASTMAAATLDVLKTAAKRTG